MTQKLFGTDGIRTKVGSSPITQEELPRLGYALSLWAQQKYNTPVFLVGHDTRESASFVKTALLSGMVHTPVTIYDAHTLPTPAICLLAKHDPKITCGIILSASHNPYYDNGIKLVDGNNGKLSPEDEKIITTIFHKTKELPKTSSNFGEIKIYESPEHKYLEKVRTFFPDEFLEEKTIVLDCAHGATSTLAPKIFTEYGAKVHVIHNTPNGININKDCGALHLESLQKEVIARNADMGFAFDGDGDRVIAVNREGIIKNGDDILTLLSTHPLYNQQKTIVGTVMTNKGFEVYLEKKNIHLERTSVGDKYISAYLKKHNLLLGGEQSGHIITRDYLETGDGIFTALRVAQSVIATENWDMHTFKTYPQILVNVPISIKKDLSQPPLSTIIKQGEGQLASGRILVRYSGTEKLLRVMVEDEQKDTAKTVVSTVSQALKKELYF